jgi:hypothetical protein
MPPVHSEVRIDSSMPAVRTYLGRVPNLACWTTFFRSVGAECNGRYEVDSIVGPIVTWIETESGRTTTRHSICSMINGELERATLDLREVERGVSVRFEVHLPAHLDGDAVSEQEAEMCRELSVLKDLVEAGHARD